MTGNLSLLIALALAASSAESFKERFPETQLVPIEYRNPGLAVDLGVGLWAQPFPLDFDGDGDHDLLVATADVPSRGLYFFENSSGDVKFPVFKPPVWLGEAGHNMTVSYLEAGWRMMREGRVYTHLEEGDYKRQLALKYKPDFHLGRAKQWKHYDYDGDGDNDLVIGASDWREYGWDNAFNAQGEWTRGPLHGHVYVVPNGGTDESPDYGKSFRVEADGKPIDVYGCPSPNLADFDGDGDLDLVCGEFLDRISYFENTGTRTAPAYAAGRFIAHDGAIIRMDLQMLQVIAFDWDKDGDMDLVVGQEDGRVALVEHTGEMVGGMPAFLPPRFFEQEAQRVKVGALCTPVSADWDADGDEDLIVGDTAGYVSFVENLDGGAPPSWAEPLYIEAGGKTLRIQAGPNGSIQGPAEAKWGYTVLDVADWNHDGRLDIVLNSIWGEVLWYENTGTPEEACLAAAKPVEVEWPGATPKPAWLWWTPKGKQLVTQWRTSPIVIDLNHDGLNDLVMLDHEGYLAFFERQQTQEAVVLLPGQRIFHDEDGSPLQPNPKPAGKSGRRKLCIADWDGDGRLDLLMNSENIDFWRNIGNDEKPWVFKNEGKVDSHRLAGHTTCPTTVQWNPEKRPGLLIGAEDGFLYYLKNR